MPILEKLDIANNYPYLNRIHADCSPLQEIRELLFNSIQSILRTQSQIGTIVWDIDWRLHERNGSKKLSICDTGDGIPADRMSQFLNRLSSGINEIDVSSDNYGIGAKIAALPANKVGLAYKSWVSGSQRGSAIMLGASDGEYGLLPLRGPNGTRLKQGMVSLESAPSSIQEAGHGTLVTLHGNDHRANTLEPSAPKFARGGKKWLSKYVNSKLFEFPDTITIKTREWDDNHIPRERPGGKPDSPNLLRRIVGVKKFLEDHKESSGCVRLEEAIVHGMPVKANAYWWVLKDENALQSAKGYGSTGGVVACIHNNNGVTEVYELQEHHQQMKSFGVFNEHHRVAIYIQPDEDTTGLRPNSGRDKLRIGSEETGYHDMPWHQWQREFSAKLPDEIEALNDRRGSRNQDKLQDKLRDLHDFFDDVDTYARSRKNWVGMLVRKRLTEKQDRDRPFNPDAPDPGPLDPNQDDVLTDDYVEVFEEVEIVEDETTEILVPDVLPAIEWITNDAPEDVRQSFNLLPADKSPDGVVELTDRMAHYYPSERGGTIRANFDFRWFQQFVGKMISDETSKPKIKQIICETMDAYGTVLVETVLGITSLSKDHSTWSDKDVQAALNEEALTAAAMARFHMKQVLLRDIRTKIGRPTEAEEPVPA